ncbi:MAG: hypothetical protein AB1427_03090 [Thermodesulfobacteriota bacterium]
MIYIGNFLHLTNQEESLETERRHGEFNLIVQADSRDDAIAMFKDRILKQREISGFFGGDCSIYFVELLELEKIPEADAMILNFKSIAGDPLMPFIACSVPTEQTDACRIFDWNNKELAVDGNNNKLFLTFKKNQ